MDAPLAQEALTLLGESVGFWIQTTAIIVTGIAAVISIRTNGRSSQHRATIDLLLAQKTDQNLIDAKKVVSNLHKNGEFTELACRAMMDDPRRASILVILNNYEFIALGIREGALDGRIYKRACYSQLLRDWRAMNPFIVELRTQNNIETLFQEFEYLAKQWQRRPLKVSK